MDNNTQAGIGGFAQGFSSTFFPGLRANEQEAVKRQALAQRAAREERNRAFQDFQMKIMAENQQTKNRTREVAGMQGLDSYRDNPALATAELGYNPFEYEKKQQSPQLERIEMDGGEGPGIYLYNPQTGAVSQRKIGGLVQKSPTTTVTNSVNTANKLDKRPIVGKPPAGYQMTYEEGKGWVQSPIIGSGVAGEKAQSAKTQGVAGAVATREIDYLLKQMGADINTGELVGESSISGPKLRSVYGSSALSPLVAGTETGDWLNTLQSVKDTIAIGRLLEIKASGAGLGQVPQSQLDALSRALGNLDKTTSDKLLAANLADVRRIYSNVVDMSVQDSGDKTFSGILKDISGKSERLKNADDEADRLLKLYGGK